MGRSFAVPPGPLRVLLRVLLLLGLPLPVGLLPLVPVGLPPVLQELLVRAELLVPVGLPPVGLLPLRGLL